jgi:ribose 5-phosphate isomerase B
MRFYFGSDHGAVELRRHLVECAKSAGHAVLDELGPQSAADKVDYPDVAVDVCRKVAADPGSFGVLMCGTGQGMAMSANRIRGIRAGVCADVFSARMSRAHNDANVLCLGGRVLGKGLAVALFEAFCETQFEGGRHERRVAKINAI